MASLGSSFKMAAKAKDIKAAGVNQREMFEALFDDSFQDVRIQLNDGFAFTNRLFLDIFSIYNCLKLNECMETVDDSLYHLLLPDVSQKQFSELMTCLRDGCVPTQTFHQHNHWIHQQRFWDLRKSTSIHHGRLATQNPDDNAAWKIISKNLSPCLALEIDGGEKCYRNLGTDTFTKKYLQDAKKSIEFDSIILDLENTPSDNQEIVQDKCIAELESPEFIGSTIFSEPLLQSFEFACQIPVGNEVNESRDISRRFHEIEQQIAPRKKSDHNSQCENALEDVIDQNSKVVKLSQCNHCGKHFADKRSLLRHLRSVHSNTKDKHCEKCGKSFALENYLTEHMKTVHCDGETRRRWICDMCGESLGSRKGLESHRLVHSLETKNIPCPHCPKLFRHRNVMKKHVARVHEFDPGARLQCSTCNKFFNHKEGLKRHEKKFHSTVQAYACSLCSSSFAFNYDLTKHMKSRHINSSSTGGGSARGRSKKMSLQAKIDALRSKCGLQAQPYEAGCSRPVDPPQFSVHPVMATKIGIKPVSLFEPVAAADESRPSITKELTHHLVENPQLVSNSEIVKLNSILGK